jgi:hypothetical protein
VRREYPSVAARGWTFCTSAPIQPRTLSKWIWSWCPGGVSSESWQCLAPAPHTAGEPRPVPRCAGSLLGRTPAARPGAERHNCYGAGNASPGDTAHAGPGSRLGAVPDIAASHPAANSGARCCGCIPASRIRLAPVSVIFLEATDGCCSAQRRAWPAALWPAA